MDPYHKKKTSCDTCRGNYFFECIEQVLRRARIDFVAQTINSFPFSSKWKRKVENSTFSAMWEIAYFKWKWKFTTTSIKEKLAEKSIVTAEPKKIAVSALRHFCS